MLQKVFWRRKHTQEIVIRLILTQMFILIIYKLTKKHLRSGILCSREKEGAYTLCDSMDATGEHYAK